MNALTPEPTYASCPFCGGDAVGPTYSQFDDLGKTWYVAKISCNSCGAHGPVRNDYPENPIASPEDEAKADEIEDWILAAWNRMPAVSDKSAERMDARKQIR